MQSLLTAHHPEDAFPTNTAVMAAWGFVALAFLTISTLSTLHWQHIRQHSSMLA